MDYRTRQVQSKPLNLSDIPGGDYKPVDLCRKLEILARFGAESSHSQRVFD